MRLMIGVRTRPMIDVSGTVHLVVMSTCLQNSDGELADCFAIQYSVDGRWEVGAMVLSELSISSLWLY